MSSLTEVRADWYAVVPQNLAEQTPRGIPIPLAWVIARRDHQRWFDVSYPCASDGLRRETGCVEIRYYRWTDATEAWFADEGYDGDRLRHIPPGAQDAPPPAIHAVTYGEPGREQWKLLTPKLNRGDAEAASDWRAAMTVVWGAGAAVPDAPSGTMGTWYRQYQDALLPMLATVTGPQADATPPKQVFRQAMADLLTATQSDVHLTTNLLDPTSCVLRSWLERATPAPLLADLWAELGDATPDLPFVTVYRQTHTRVEDACVPLESLDHI